MDLGPLINIINDFGTSVELARRADGKPHFVMAVHRAPHSVLLATQDSAGYMIVDTACQRTCCGETWFESHLAVQNIPRSTDAPQSNLSIETTNTTSTNRRSGSSSSPRWTGGDLC